MLADRKVKQKISVDPRNTNWINNDENFGHKLMEKMGWTKGKGLGANGNGMTDFIKTQMRIDNRGVGCSKNHADKWIEHQDDFNQLLNNLNEGSTADAVKIGSLEEKSKLSRSRVHYSKFTRGKDLSAKSESDLNCIFGNRRKVESSVNLSEETPIEKQYNTFESKQSVQDYFASKMKLLKKNRAQPDMKEDLNTDNIRHVVSSDNSPSLETKKTKKSKKKEKSNDASEVSGIDAEDVDVGEVEFGNSVGHFSLTDNSSLSHENHSEQSALYNRVHLVQNGSQATSCLKAKNIKKSKKKEKGDLHEVNDVKNEGVDDHDMQLCYKLKENPPADRNVKKKKKSKKEKVILDEQTDFDKNTFDGEKKRKRKANQTIDTQLEHVVENGDCYIENGFDSNDEPVVKKMKKSKKEKKKEKVVCETGIQLCADNSTPEENSGNKITKKKKKSRNDQEKVIGVEQIDCKENSFFEGTKRKRKANKIADTKLEHVSENGWDCSLENDINLNDEPVVKKKKKSKKEKRKEVVCETGVHDLNSEESSVKKIKKKKERKDSHTVTDSLDTSNSKDELNAENTCKSSKKKKNRNEKSITEVKISLDIAKKNKNKHKNKDKHPNETLTSIEEDHDDTSAESSEKNKNEFDRLVTTENNSLNNDTKQERKKRKNKNKPSNEILTIGVGRDEENDQLNRNKKKKLNKLVVEKQNSGKGNKQVEKKCDDKNMKTPQKLENSLTVDSQKENYNQEKSVEDSFKTIVKSNFADGLKSDIESLPNIARRDMFSQEVLQQTELGMKCSKEYLKQFKEDVRLIFPGCNIEDITGYGTNGEINITQLAIEMKLEKMKNKIESQHGWI